MKKFKTYGKFKSKRDLKSDDWDEIKDAKADAGHLNIKNKYSYIVIDDTNEISTQDDDTKSFCDDTDFTTDEKQNGNCDEEKQEIVELFDQLSINNHSTPLISSTEEKSKSDTPLKPNSSILRKERLSSSDYSFTCKRSVSFFSSTRKSIVKKTLGSYSNPIPLDEISLVEPSFHSTGNVSFKDALTTSLSYTETEKKILSICDQGYILPLAQAVDFKFDRKIGEGSYGEVFLKTEGEKLIAVKIVPVGDHEDQIKLDDIIPEMAISNKLSNWVSTKVDKELYEECRVEGFVELIKLQFCKGPFPKHLTALWEDWKMDSKNDCENEHPDIYDEEQKYVIFENKFGGVDLEKFKVKNMKEALSILKQLVATLASAECSLQFEHRDLHWGNILVGEIEKTKKLYILVDQKEYEIVSHGLTVSIIDFTLARLLSEECIVFTDLSDEKVLFEGEGDEQFDIYRTMKEHNKNEWESFNPYTNVLWIHYVTIKLISKLRKNITMKKLAARILQYKSAYEMLTEDELFV